MILIKNVTLLMISFIFMSCSDMLEPFKEMTKVSPCNPSLSVYQSNFHYFERDFLDVDGSLDYNKLIKLNRPDTSPCDPLYDQNLIHKVPRNY